MIERFVIVLFDFTNAHKNVKEVQQEMFCKRVETLKISTSTGGIVPSRSQGLAFPFHIYQPQVIGDSSVSQTNE